jgi:hypothetical protein
MTGYITSGSFRGAQDFTTDLARAADSLRILRSNDSATPFNPYVEVVEALRRFDTQPAGRRMALLVSDGLDVSRGGRSDQFLEGWAGEIPLGYSETGRDVERGTECPRKANP